MCDSLSVERQRWASQAACLTNVDTAASPDGRQLVCGEDVLPEPSSCLLLPTRETLSPKYASAQPPWETRRYCLRKNSFAKHVLVPDVRCCLRIKKRSGFFPATKHDDKVRSSRCGLRHSPKELNIHGRAETCTWMFTAALCVTARTWRPPRRPPAAEGTNTLCH